MKRLFLALTLTLALGGCANLNKIMQAVGGFAITQQQIDAARSTYDGSVLVPLAKYASFPRCAKGVTISISNLCHDRVLLVKIRNADKAVAKAFSDTQDMVTSGNNQGAVAAYDALKTAIGAAQALIAVSGVPSF